MAGRTVVHLARKRYAGPVPTPEPDQLWEIRDIAAATGLKPQTIRWHRCVGHLPPEDQMLGRSPGWRYETIRPWLDGRTR
jgi:predicted DNA-binding transcriptional regulator AlpA